MLKIKSIGISTEARSASGVPDGASTITSAPPRRASLIARTSDGLLPRCEIATTASPVRSKAAAML